MFHGYLITSVTLFRFHWNSGRIFLPCDGSKTCALREDGTGLIYRGPFVYRRSASGDLELESVAFGHGRLTPDGLLLQTFRPSFKENNINIDDPKFGVWLDLHLHRKHAKEYNDKWEKFFEKHPTFTEKEAESCAEELMKTVYKYEQE